MIDLVHPRQDEVAGLLLREPTFRDFAVAAGALPPRVITDQGRRGLVDHPLAYRWSMPFLIVLVAERTVVGSVGGKGYLPDDTEVELGYNVAPDYRRRGIATQAVAEVVRLAMEDGLSTLAHVEPANSASAKVLANTGFRLEERIVLPAGFQLDRYRRPRH